MNVTVSGVWLLSLAALIVLWWKRPCTVLDLWLMVVMCAWLFDIALPAVFNTGRYDLGFYAGRAYGLAATGFVQMVLLLQNTWIYSRMVKAHNIEHQEHTHDQRRLPNRFESGFSERSGQGNGQTHQSQSSQPQAHAKDPQKATAENKAAKEVAEEEDQDLRGYCKRPRGPAFAILRRST